MAKSTFLAENLKYFRNLSRMTQDQLSSRLGIKRSTLGAYEEGRAEPDPQMLLKMARLFNVTIEILISYDRKEGENDGKYVYMMTETFMGDIHRKLDLVKHLIGDIEKKLSDKNI